MLSKKKLMHSSADLRHWIGEVWNYHLRDDNSSDIHLLSSGWKLFYKLSTWDSSAAIFWVHQDYPVDALACSGFDCLPSPSPAVLLVLRNHGRTGCAEWAKVVRHGLQLQNNQVFQHDLWAIQYGRPELLLQLRIYLPDGRHHFGKLRGGQWNPIHRQKDVQNSNISIIRNPYLKIQAP